MTEETGLPTTTAIKNAVLNHEWNFGYVPNKSEMIESLARLIEERVRDGVAKRNAESSPKERDFFALVDRMFVSRRGGADGFLHAAVGLAGEAGEVLEMIKKSWVYDKPLDFSKVEEEMGDVLHYFTMLCILTNLDWTTVIENNMAKLAKRYPNGYSNSAAIARADKVEKPHDHSH